MDTDAIDDLIAQLRADLDAEKRERERLRTDFDLLSSKLRVPGTKFLVDLEYRLVYDATLTATAAALTTSAAFETLPGTLHALYVLSAYAPSSNTPVLITDGSVIVAPANAVTVAVQRQRATSPTRIEAKVALYNSGAADASVAVRVWRRLGMGS